MDNCSLFAMIRTFTRKFSIFHLTVSWFIWQISNLCYVNVELSFVPHIKLWSRYLTLKKLLTTVNISVFMFICFAYCLNSKCYNFTNIALPFWLLSNVHTAYQHFLWTRVLKHIKYIEIKQFSKVDIKENNILTVFF